MTFDPVLGTARETFDRFTDTLDPRTFSEDFRRLRARFFDGRFLTARDLTREQQYTLIRQADLGQGGGGGVVSGLRVRGAVNARTLLIGGGYGFTPAGEGVRLTRNVVINVGNLPTIERLDATFGLAALPGEPTATSSGVFVLALRPVEFTDNPTVSYPVGLDDRRRLEAGEIVEASALILIPFEKTGQDAVSTQTRAALARAIFFERGLGRLSGEVLPLAVVALDRGNVAFVDEFLVRRNLGSSEVLRFGLGERAVREAFLLQYTAHLADIERSRRKSGQRDPFAAGELFEVLPPFGPLPAGAVEVGGDAILHSFFPPDMNVELTIVPSDELASLAEESLAFAPLDLRETNDVHELTAVLICIPMDPELYAQKFAQFRPKGTGLEQRSQRPTQRVTPIAALDALRRRRLGVPSPAPNALDVGPWALALQSARQLYYVRRRQLPQVSFVVPRFSEVGNDDPTRPNRSPALWTAPVRERLVQAGELQTAGGTGPLRRFDLLVRRAVIPAGANPSLAFTVVTALHTFFQLDVFATETAARTEARLLVNAAVAELAQRARVRLEDLVRAQAFPETTPPGGPPPLAARQAVVRVRALRSEDVAALTPLYDRNHASNNPQFGQGLRALIAAEPALNQPLERGQLAASLRVRELDAFIRRAAPNLTDLARALLIFVRAGDIDGIARVASGVEPQLAARVAAGANPAGGNLSKRVSS